MDALPSVWGRHDQAYIDPVVVRGKLVTSIAQAPEQWTERLTSLGFLKRNNAWLRLGPVTPSEFALISPDIDLVGLRPDDVLDAPGDPAIGYDTSVPFDVRDTILSLWQRQIGSVLVALSMENEINPTRSQAWSFVEAALAGQITPETETLFGLAFTKMAKAKAMSPDAEAFAADLGWTGLATSAVQGRSRGKVVLGKGEAVNWADSSGVIHTGRLAQRMTDIDVGCWVYKGAPHWVGGYIATAPLWVSRAQLQYPGLYEDEAQIPDLEGGSALFDSLQSHDFSLDAGTTATLNRVLNAGRMFPFEGWRQFCSALTFDDETSNDAFRTGVLELERIDAALSELSALYYGLAPIRFKLTGHGAGQVHFTCAVELSGKPILSHWLSMPAIDDGELKLAELAQGVETSRLARETEMVKTAAELSKRLGIDGIAAHVSAFGSAYPMLWPKVGQHYQGQATDQDLMRLFAVIGVSGDQEAYMLRRSARQPVSESLGFDLKLRDAGGFSAVSFQAYQHDARLVRISDAIIAMSADGADANWIDAVPKVERSVYSLNGCLGRSLPAEKARLVIEALSTSPASKLTANIEVNVLFESLEDLMSGYGKVLASLEPLASELTVGEIKGIRQVMAGLPLRERALRACSLLAKTDKDVLIEFLRAELQRQLPKHMAGWGDEFVGRVVDRGLSYLRADATQAVVVVSSPTANRSRLFFQSVPYDDASLSQSREAVLTQAAADYKTRNRLRGAVAIIDGLSLVDPQLCSILNGEVAVLKAEQKSATGDGYVDTGVVAGLAIKDIRGMDRVTLAQMAEAMNDAQKGKYLSKDLIWPRKSFDELKELGVPLSVAFAYDTLWKGLPAKPKSTGREHVLVYVSLISNMKESIGNLLGSFAPPTDPRLTDTQQLQAFSSQAVDLTREVVLDIPRLSAVYRTHEQKIRGTNCFWSHYQPHYSSQFMRKLNDLSWSEVLKAKKVALPNAGGSRVARDAVVREGPDYRHGVSVDGADFIRTFGFSGIEYGNWTSQKEREKHLNFAYDSMMDFARVMGWEPMALSLGGRLGLCIGSRGRGGSRTVAAHFEPANMAINLTRMRGDGSLAHEYFHAVAYHYGRLATGRDDDITNSFGYSLQKEGALPAKPNNGLREPVRDAFFDLMVAIMRSPVGDDFKAIPSYTEQSGMLAAAMSEDGPSADYWAKPGEMFARSMEIWFKDRLAENGERNDYLVRAGKDMGSSPLYPTEEHLSRINHFVSPLLEAIRTEVRQVEHPYLGSIEMPVLNSKLRSRAPLNSGDLVELAQRELSRLFKSCMPNVVLVNGMAANAGLYDLANNLIQLNSGMADAGTIYHEAWHACHSTLLTVDEQGSLREAFGPGGELYALLEAAMRIQGMPNDVIAHALSQPEEAQAYAFQMWADGTLDLGAGDSQPFTRAKTFIDGVLGVAEMFTPKDVERLFERFMSGELAERKQTWAVEQSAEVASSHGADMLVWTVDPAQGHREMKPPHQSRLGL